MGVGGVRIIFVGGGAAARCGGGTSLGVAVVINK